MVHFGPFWPEEVHFGPFMSANRTLAIPDFCRFLPMTRLRLENLHFPVLPFLAFLEKKARKTTQRTRIFYPYRTPKISGKEGKNAQKNKKFLAGEKRKEFQKSKERKGRVINQTDVKNSQDFPPGKRATHQGPLLFGGKFSISRKFQARLKFLRSGRGTVGKCTGPKWSTMVKTTILVKMNLFQTGF